MIKKIIYYWESYKIQKEKDSINRDIEYLNQELIKKINELDMYPDCMFLEKHRIIDLTHYENQFLSLKKRADNYSDDCSLFFLANTIISLKEEIEKKSQIAKNGLEKANSQQYKHWLRKYINAGYKPTHFYDYNCFEGSITSANGRFTRDRDENLYIATKNFEVPAACGSSSLCIIIPKGIKFTQPKHNHCSFYYEDPELIGKSGSFIPSHSDIF